MKRGFVYIIGAGPGDASLITVKGVRCLKEADTVIYDHLVNPRLLRHAKKEAELIFAGKKAGYHTLSQDEINHILKEKAAEGRIVARLKGGDPFIFGRGGEEAEFLAASGIPFEVVPGITSAIAVPTYAGIPLTHRKLNAEVTFITGHEDPSKKESSINWTGLAQGRATLVFLMGIAKLRENVSRLIEKGRSASTPAAVIQWGTTAKQKTVTATLSAIAEKAAKAGISPPAVLVVGDVVKLREKLNWFEKKPLFGLNIVVTRPARQAGVLSDLLEKNGAQAIEFPTIEIAEPDSWGETDAFIRELPHYDWIVFTSTNGVERFVARLLMKGLDIRAMWRARICAIGPATASALERSGIRADLIPPRYRSEEAAEALCKKEISGKRILIPRAQKARDILPEILRKAGARVDLAPVYKTILPQNGKTREIRSLLEKREVDIVTFTSSSTVENFVKLMPDATSTDLLSGVLVACIGPVTAETARSLGIETDIMPERYTIPDLALAMIDHIRKRETQKGTEP